VIIGKSVLLYKQEYGGYWGLSQIRFYARLGGRLRTGDPRLAHAQDLQG